MSSLALKIGSLLVRTLSKPIANTIKAQAKEHKAFRKACIEFAQWMHRAEFRITGINRAKSGGANVRLRPLNDAKAVDAGATFLSETFIFTVAGGAILFETWRARRKEKNRRDEVAEAILGLQHEIVRINEIMEKQFVLQKKKNELQSSTEEIDSTEKDFDELHKVILKVERELHTLRQNTPSQNEQAEATPSKEIPRETVSEKADHPPSSNTKSVFALMSKF